MFRRQLEKRWSFRKNKIQKEPDENSLDILKRVRHTSFPSTSIIPDKGEKCNGNSANRFPIYSTSFSPGSGKYRHRRRVVEDVDADDRGKVRWVRCWECYDIGRVIVQCLLSIL